MTIEHENGVIALLVNCDSRRASIRYHGGCSYRFDVLFLRRPHFDFAHTQRFRNFRWLLLHSNLPLPPRALCVILIEIIPVLHIHSLISIAPSGAVPEVERVALHPIRGRNDLEQVPASDLYRWDLGCWEPDKVGEDTSDDRGMSDDKKVFLFSLELDKS